MIARPPSALPKSPAVTSRNPPADSFTHTGTHPLLPEQSPQQHDETQSSALGAGKSRFVEINRDSAQYSRRFSIGQRVKVDEAGQYVPDPSPDSENGNPISSTGHGSTDTHDSATSTPGGEHVANSSHSPQHIAQGYLTQSSSPRGEEYADVRDHRSRLLALNADIEQHQRAAFSSVAKGEGNRGWVLVGRGMRYFPRARQIDGGTKQDIIWANIDARPHTGVFWLKVLLVGIGLSIISEFQDDPRNLHSLIDCSHTFHWSHCSHGTRIRSLPRFPSASSRQRWIWQRYRSRACTCASNLSRRQSCRLRSLQ